MTSCRPRCLLADRAYDAGILRTQLEVLGCQAHIPPNRSRASRVRYDRDTYKARSAIECTIRLLKEGRRFATRYEKTMRNYSAIVTVSCILCWLR
jgi:transposase